MLFLLKNFKHPGVEPRPSNTFLHKKIKKMMIDIDKEEIEALHTWNCAMLLKRKNRALQCKYFSNWKQSINVLSNSRTQESSFTARNTDRIYQRSGTQKQQEFTHKALQDELNSLLEEQKELEEATAKIKETLRDIPRPSQSQYRSQYSSFSGRYSQTGRLNYK